MHLQQKVVALVITQIISKVCFAMHLNPRGRWQISRSKNLKRYLEAKNELAVRYCIIHTCF